MELQKRLEEIFGRPDLFYCSNDEQKEIKEYLIPEAFKHHFENCGFYQKYCVNVGVYPENIKYYDDIKKIPLLPSSIFKNEKVITGSEDNIFKMCTSSGTKGSVSTVYRDEDTIHNFFESSKLNIKEMLNVENGEWINLTPLSSSSEVKHLWIAYAMEYTAKFYPSVFCVENGKLDVDRVYENLDRVLKSGKTAILIGPPTLMLKLVNDMKVHNIKFEYNSNIRFITAGGWKKFTGISISRDELLSRLQECFGNIESWQCRDIYNMVELNTIIGECEYNHKHILPWLSVFALDPVTLSPIENEKKGIMAYIDPTAISYPCFILSDDIGSILHNVKCNCARTGDIFRFERRITTTEVRGCALKMDKQYQVGK